MATRIYTVSVFQELFWSLSSQGDPYAEDCTNLDLAPANNGSNLNLGLLYLKLSRRDEIKQSVIGEAKPLPSITRLGLALPVLQNIC